MNLNPLIAKLKPNGNVQCLICNLEVKPKIWTAHLNGKRHRDCIENLKVSTQKKRSNVLDTDEAPPPKKNKAEGPTSLPNDFYDNGANVTEYRNREKVSNNFAGIEGVPKGFFDDRKMDDKSKDAKVKNAVLDAEFERWKEEIGEEQNQQETKEEEKVANEQLSLELERIDEQMAAYKKLNDLEIQKERRLNQAKEKRKKRIEDSADEGEDIEINLDDIDWRSKEFFS